MKNILHLYRCGTWFQGLYLDEEEIKTEKYENFELYFSQQKYELEDIFEIKDHCNIPFSPIEQFEYYFDDLNADKVYVRENNTKDGLLIGINIANFKGKMTSIDAIQRILRYQELKKFIVRLFKEKYELLEELENESILSS